MLHHEQLIGVAFLTLLVWGFFWPQFEFCMQRTLNPTEKGLEELQHPAKSSIV